MENNQYIRTHHTLQKPVQKNIDEIRSFSMEYYLTHSNTAPQFEVENSWITRETETPDLME